MNIVAYYRVSTKTQGESGLGLEAQRASVVEFAYRGHHTIIAEHTEVESGKVSHRPKLAAALAQAKSSGATLVIAKLDRLSRNLAFVAALMDSGVEFVACDNPNANRLTIHVLAAVAEDEARRISERTKAALAAAKARGVLLGSARPGHWTPEMHQKRVEGLKSARIRSITSRSRAASQAYAEILPTIVARRRAGDSLLSISRQLNSDGQRTVRGAPFLPSTVLRILERFTRMTGVVVTPVPTHTTEDVNADTNQEDGSGAHGELSEPFGAFPDYVETCRREEVVE